MRYSNQFIKFITTISLLVSSSAHAIDFYAESLYWQAAETVDWALTNNFSLPNQVIAYKTIDFNFAPGFRVGAGFQNKDWSGRALYTRYNVREKATTHGEVLSTLMLGKFAETFYQTGQVHFTIDFNMFDLDLYKSIHIDESLVLNPIIGFKGGWINQRVNTGFQGQISVSESVTNNFSGFGPKVGIEGQWSFYKNNDYQYSLVADFSSAYMWGKWSIHDSLTQSNSSAKSFLNVGKRDLGAFEMQGLIGINLSYKQYAIKLGYEVSDWFNQYQVFDNGSGTHTNNLILQGITLAFNYTS